MIHVVAAVIVDSEKGVLLSQRPVGKHQGGLWEFPGGKVDAGESARQALCRELKEELDIEVVECAYWRKVEHHYSDKSVSIEFWWVTRFTGTPKGMEAQPVAWFTPDSLSELEFPQANVPIVACLPQALALLPA